MVVDAGQYVSTGGWLYDSIPAVIAGGAEPTLALSNTSVPEDADIGDLVGILSVQDGSGVYVYTLTADPDGRFKIVGDQLQVAEYLDYESTDGHPVTISASNGVDPPVVGQWVIAVTDVAHVLPATGLVAEWRFAEGAGTIASDSVGTYHIDLTAPTDPNTVWTATGVRSTLGLVQTPSITGARTICLLYKLQRDDTAGFIISGGPGGSGGGTMGDFATPSFGNHMASNNGVAPLRHRSNGQAAWRQNRGGWGLLFVTYGSASNTILGLGGRHSTTTSRCAQIDIGWAAVYNTTLTDEQRRDVYDYVRDSIAKPRGVYLDVRDCPVRADAVLLWGQSNAVGEALISAITPEQAALPTTQTYIMATASNTNSSGVPAQLAIGVNNNVTGKLTVFGPEMASAWAHETEGERRLYICKSVRGSTWLAPASVGAPVTEDDTWNPTATETAGSWHRCLSRHWWDMEAAARNAGVGLHLRAVWWMQGEQDATLEAASAEYRTSLQALYEQTVTYSGQADLKMIVARIRDEDPAGDPDAQAEVRAAQEDFVLDNSAVATMIDTDGFALSGDNVHYNAAGQIALGEAFYEATFGA